MKWSQSVSFEACLLSESEAPSRGGGGSGQTLVSLSTFPGTTVQFIYWVIFLKKNKWSEFLKLYLYPIHLKIYGSLERNKIEKFVCDLKINLSSEP